MIIFISRFILALSMLIMMSACVTVSEEYYTGNEITPSELLSGQAILGMPVKSGDLPDDNVLAMTAKMDAFLNEYIPSNLTAPSKARKLNDALFNKNKLAMIYEVGQTYTAQQTFENKTGNCLSFAYLYSVMAKKLGLDVIFQEVDILPEWDRASDQLLISSRHVNLRLKIYGSDDLVVDIDQINLNRFYKTTAITQSHAVALYYSNMAMDFLVDEQYEKALKYLLKGLSLEPKSSILWANLGVIYRRSGHNDHAERSYFMALEYDKNNSSSINNLAYLYSQTGEQIKAEYFAKRSQSHQLRNPFYRYGQAQIDLNEMRYKSALKHIKYAIRINKDIAQFYMLQSEILERLGNKRDAQKSIRAAERLKSA